MKQSFRHIRISTWRAADSLWTKLRTVHWRLWLYMWKRRLWNVVAGTLRRLTWASTAFVAKVAPRIVPRISLSMAAAILCDVSDDTAMRQWMELAFPHDPDRQMLVFKRAILFEGTPLYGRQPPSRVVRPITKDPNGLRPVRFGNNLVSIDTPALVLYTDVSVPITALWRVARRIRRHGCG